MYWFGLKDIGVGPAYKLEDFINDCAKGTSKAFVTTGALLTAGTHFNLPTQEQVLDFISNDGLEKPQYINSEAWDKNPEPQNIIMIDAYSFYSGLLFGYIAFLFQPKTGKWVIKSFKKNREIDTRNLAFLGPLTKLLT